MKFKRITSFYRFVYAKKKVQIFDLYTLEWSSKQLDKRGWNNLVDNCQVIQTEKCRIFLIGGHYSHNQYSTQVSEYIPQENLLVEKASFNLERTNFSLCSILGYLIYMVGGCFIEDDKIKMSAKTEKYYIEDDDWDILLPELNTGKAGVSLCKFQNTYLYAFGGDNGRHKKNIVSEIERLDLLEEENPDQKHWELLFIKHKQMTPFAYGLSLLLDDSKILIVGGKQNIVSLTKTYIYDLSEDKIKPFDQQLIDSDYFQRSGPQFGMIYNQLFIMGQCYIHCYSFELNKWITASQAFQSIESSVINNVENQNDY